MKAKGLLASAVINMGPTFEFLCSVLKYTTSLISTSIHMRDKGIGGVNLSVNKVLMVRQDLCKPKI